MKYIKVKEASCKSCLNCLKICMVKSIEFYDDKVNIVDDQCILCGRCVTVCPQEAKLVDSDFDKIKKMVKNPAIKTFVSLAPSYLSIFDGKYKSVTAVLKRLGFDMAEETAIGAAYVTSEYNRLINEEKMDSIITTACPTINMLITKYYPELVKYLAPVLSPMVAHAKLIKREYGDDVKVIFIGPCLSKIKEAEDYSQYVDGAMTFKQLAEWIEEENIDLDSLDSNVSFNRESPFSRIYPIKDGILLDLEERYNKNTIRGSVGKYNCISVSGLHEVRSMLEEIKLGKVKHIFAEVNACRGGCVNGPMLPDDTGTWYRNRISIRSYALQADTAPVEADIALNRSFEYEDVSREMPTEEEIQTILRHIGKYSKEQEINCGSCGYPTCREKAIAVYQKKADIYMCLAYMSDISQTLSNVILSITPDYIIAVDKNMRIKEINFAAQRLFKVARSDAINKPIEEFISAENFEQVFREQKNIIDKKVKYADLNKITTQTIIYSEKQNIAVATIKDITEEELERENIYNTKLESLNMAQKVIDKQMTVAQQIASLLGETTAETKVTLDKLKNLIENEGQESL